MTLAAKLSRIFVLLLLTAGLAAHAQVVGGTIDGLVHDASGAAVSGATVVVRQAETGASRTLTTDADGRFFAPSLPVGPYAVSVAHDGFETQQHTGISLTVGQSLALNFVLGLATVQQQVVVVDSGNTVNTTTQQTAGLIDERQVKELPLNGRSYDELLTLNPATVNYTNERSGGIGSSNSSVGNMFAVSGRRPGQSLPAQWDRVHRRLTHQRHAGRHQRTTPRRRCGPRVQRRHRYIRRHLRKTRRRAGQHRHLVRHQSSARNGLRVHPQQRARRPQFL